MMKVDLSTGDEFLLYDTAGPYRDTNFKQDSELGITKLRKQWILERGDVQLVESSKESEIFKEHQVFKAKKVLVCPRCIMQKKKASSPKR